MGPDPGVDERQMNVHAQAVECPTGPFQPPPAGWTFLPPRWGPPSELQLRVIPLMAECRRRRLGQSPEVNHPVRVLCSCKLGHGVNETQGQVRDRVFGACVHQQNRSLLHDRRYDPGGSEE